MEEKQRCLAKGLGGSTSSYLDQSREGGGGEKSVVSTEIAT